LRETKGHQPQYAGIQEDKMRDDEPVTGLVTTSGNVHGVADSHAEEPSQFDNMSGPELLRWYNTTIDVAEAYGHTDFRPVKVFHDRACAIKRCKGLKNYLNARKEGLEAQEHQKETVKATEVGDAPPNNTGLRGHENPISAGRARMQADPAKAENIRQEVLADQAKAAELAAPSEDWGPTQEKKVAKKAKKVKAGNGDAHGRAASFKDDQKITILAEANPKREGTRGHEVFSIYKTGMLVSTFIEKVGSRGEAFANLRHDTGKEFVKVG
jgi:hypothetical protein